MNYTKDPKAMRTKALKFYQNKVKFSIELRPIEIKEKHWQPLFEVILAVGGLMILALLYKIWFT
ncbi:hypothetical protein [Pedobacter duraquae]|uniref:Uncharacterized protein n=1 Tax=Pedobacter duraquae TaxID=425511 RepID=A0A4R6IIV5_9SPHI|nr:hypothetical protein [Pedobacter duraquae]TDO21929.1 hypothetical protein CLV32_3037 [Pedobacter duraquae]